MSLEKWQWYFQSEKNMNSRLGRYGRFPQRTSSPSCPPHSARAYHIIKLVTWLVWFGHILIVFRLRHVPFKPYVGFSLMLVRRKSFVWKSLVSKRLCSLVKDDSSRHHYCMSLSSRIRVYSLSSFPNVSKSAMRFSYRGGSPFHTAIAISFLWTVTSIDKLTNCFTWLKFDNIFSVFFSNSIDFSAHEFV